MPGARRGRIGRVVVDEVPVPREADGEKPAAGGVLDAPERPLEPRVAVPLHFAPGADLGDGGEAAAVITDAFDARGAGDAGVRAVARGHVAVGHAGRGL